MFILARVLLYSWPFLRELLVGGNKNVYTNRRKASGVTVALLLIILVAVGDILHGVFKDQKLMDDITAYFSSGTDPTTDKAESTKIPDNVKELQLALKRISSDHEYTLFKLKNSQAENLSLNRELRQCQVELQTTTPEVEIPSRPKPSLAERAADKLKKLNL